MTRSKVQMSRIENEDARRNCFNQRKKGLIKKSNELSTLCGVECCVIISSSDCPEPDQWPSRQETEHIVQKYNNIPRSEQNRNLDPETFAKQELAKAQAKLRNAQRENRLKELEIIMAQNMTNNKAWLQSLDHDYLTYMTNHVLKPQVEKMEQRISMFNEEPSARAQE